MFRKPEFGNKVFLIAVPNESLTATWTLMDLQGNLDKQFQVRFCTSKNAARPKEKEIWPETPEENLERLADCGVPVDRRVPKCSNCNGKNSGTNEYPITFANTRQQSWDTSSLVVQKKLGRLPTNLKSSATSVRRLAIASVTAPRLALISLLAETVV